jgi:hypothetical protein
MLRTVLQKWIGWLWLLLCSLSVQAQLFQPVTYPRGFFGWPVDDVPGLVANFGELRPNHYHMGLDARTGGHENKRVLAAGDGYIAKIKIESFGFGRAIYINHPNGLTTLYAHCNDFYPALEAYVTEKQYQSKSWAQFIDLPEGLFTVKKGDFIAWSGNTGGSQGPHVHFEIRDTKTDKVLNPLLFDLPIPDAVAPDIYRLAVYDRRKSTYEQTPQLIAVKKANGQYEPKGGLVIVHSDRVSLGISAADRYSGSNNPNGIYQAALYVDDNPLAGFEMDSVSYAETRYLNAHIDFGLKSRGGPYVEHLSLLPGNSGGIYRTMPGEDGVIRLNDELPHTVKIVVKDVNGNASTLAFRIQRQGINEVPAVPASPLFFRPGQINIFESDHLRFYLPENALYDGFWFNYKETRNAAGMWVQQVHMPTVPLHAYYPFWIRSEPGLTDTAKVVMKRSYGSKDDYKKAVYRYGWYKASFREFGNMELIYDTVPPVIAPIGFRDGMNTAKLGRLLFAVSDNCEDIGSFNAYLDGNWLRFSNDKAKNFIYRFDDRCGPGEHELKLVVQDLVGNETTRIYHFTR